MIVLNAQIKYLVSSSTNMDSNGNPIEATNIWSELIDCNLKTIKRDQKGTYENGIPI